MDTRGVIAEYDGERYTLTLGSQGSHIIRDIIGGEVMKLAPDKMRVITPDVGGGFGTKLFPYREYALAAVAAERLRKPVKWVAERTEHFLGDSHGRDNVTSARLALDDKGRFLALEIDLVADMGAYLSCYGPYIPWLAVGMATGVYDIPAAHVRLRGVYTNTVPVDAYRGAGRPEASYLIERLVDAAARELDIAPDTLRKRNFIKPKAMPYTTPVGKIYNSGDFAGTMARAQELADWDGFSKRAAASKRAGRLRGIGLATYVEACGGNGPETARGAARQRRRRHRADRHAIDRARATPPPMRRSSPTGSICRRTKCASSRATPTRSRPAPAPAARARFRSAACRSIVPARNLPIRSRSLPRRSWRPRRAISKSPTARCASPAPTA